MYIYVATAVTAEVLAVVFTEITAEVVAEVLVKLAAGGLRCCS